MAKGESWETTSGLLDEYILTFEEVWFSKPQNYREGKQTVLQVRGVAYDPENEDEVLDDEKENFYSLGDGWEPDDGGETAAHGSGKTKFNQNSSMGKLINAVVGLGDDVLDELKSRGETTEAATWRGLRFLINRVEFEFKDRRTGEVNTYAVDLPVEFLGVDDATEKTAKKAAARKTTAKKTTKAEASEAADEDDAEEAPAAPTRRRRKKADDAAPDNAALRTAIVEFAAEFEEHGDFMEAVLDPDEFDQAGSVQGDEELLNDLIDEEGSIWTDSREL